ncbi:YesL family protein [Alkalihalobacillus sp. 1P02AB]|uniref:YesL family protein n=1 Tax=Alkalihalobacillus sp. 1P02AB TaxID=3132260 RepID=UPI0039A775FC
MNRLGGFFTEASSWIWKIMQLNLIWIVHIFLGGIILGVFPATIAMFSITRRWLNDGLDEPLWRNFHSYYRKNFWKGNGLGWIYSFIGGFLLFDLYLVTQIRGFVALFSTMVILLLLIVYLFSFLYFFSYYVHFKHTFKSYLIQPFIITLISLKQNVLIAIGLITIGYLIYQLPGLIPFVVGVMPAYWVMKISLNHFQKMELKME